MKNVSITIAPVGSRFACCGVVTHRGRRVHVTDTYPHDCESAARAAAERWVEEQVERGVELTGVDVALHGAPGRRRAFEAALSEVAS